jgi:ribose transport system permease protein
VAHTDDALQVEAAYDDVPGGKFFVNSPRTAGPLDSEGQQNAHVAAERRHRLQSFLARYVLLFVWALVIAGFGILQPRSFLTLDNFQVMFSSQAPLILLALALVPTLIAGELDLSIAGSMTLGATMTGQLNGVLGWPLAPSLIIGILSGGLVGAFNALLTIKVGVESIIVTLGMGTLLVGVSLWFSNSLSISGVDRAVSDFLLDRSAGMSVTFYIAVVVAIAMWYLYRHTVTGRHLIYTGENVVAARLAGIQVGRLKTASFVLGGMLASGSGVMLVGAAGGVDPNSLQPLLLGAFAGVFLGTATIEPGRPNVIGTVVAILFLITGITGLELMGISSWVSNVFYGGALVAAVTLSRIVGVSMRRFK